MQKQGDAITIINMAKGSDNLSTSVGVYRTQAEVNHEEVQVILGKLNNLEARKISPHSDPLGRIAMNLPIHLKVARTVPAVPVAPDVTGRKAWY